MFPSPLSTDRPAAESKRSIFLALFRVTFSLNPLCFFFFLFFFFFSWVAAEQRLSGQNQFVVALCLISIEAEQQRCMVMVT